MYYLEDRNGATKGFAALPLLMALLTVAVIGFVGWKVVQERAQSPTDGSANTSIVQPATENQPTPTSLPTEAPIPDGYTTYTNTELQFSFAYPAEWGELSFAPEDDGRTTGHFAAGIATDWIIRLHRSDIPFMPTDSPTHNVYGYSVADGKVTRHTTRGDLPAGLLEQYVAASTTKGRSYIVEAYQAAAYGITAYGLLEHGGAYQAVNVDYSRGDMEREFTLDHPALQQLVAIMRTFRGEL